MLAKKKFMVSSLAIFTALVLAFSFLAPATAATPQIELNIESVTAGSTIAVKLINLVDGTTYGLKRDSTWVVNFTASDADRVVYVNIPTSATGSVSLSLYDNLSGTPNLLDTVTLTIIDPEDFLNIDFFMSIAIPIFIVVLVGGFIVAFVSSRRK